jgi:hypothetical protein
MREVAAWVQIHDGFFRGVCPILEPGEKITDSKGICSPQGVVTHAGRRTNVQLNLPEGIRYELQSGSPVFFMGKRETPGAV